MNASANSLFRLSGEHDMEILAGNTASANMNSINYTQSTRNMILTYIIYDKYEL